MTADTVVRALTEDGAFRVIVADTTRTVQGVLGAQKASGPAGKVLGEMVTAAVMFRETMAPGYRVQAILKAGDGSGTIVADSAPRGDTRGLLQQKAGAGDVTLGPGSLLQMMRTLQNGKLVQGVVEVPDDGTVASAMMAYMQTSEQIVTMVGCNVLLGDDGAATRAAGYLVQLLPEIETPPLAIMTERLADFEDLSPLLSQDAFSADWLLGELLYGMDFTRLETTDVRFHCWCSEVRVMGALASLGRGELEGLMEQGEALEIDCDYCGKHYEVAPAQLQGLLKES